jgi:ferritin
VNPDIQKAVNDQIGMELSSAYTYLAWSAHFEEQSFTGLAQWMRLQAKEELGHAVRFLDHVLERGGHVNLPAVAAPAAAPAKPAEVFAAALSQEKAVTASINALYDLARQKKDYAIEPLLQWFVTEQVEEENSVGLAVEQLQRAGDSMPALLLLDARMGSRTSAE